MEGNFLGNFLGPVWGSFFWSFWRSYWGVRCCVAKVLSRNLIVFAETGVCLKKDPEIQPFLAPVSGEAHLQVSPRLYY